jgi:molybdopterin molybdotransferase
VAPPVPDEPQEMRDALARQEGQQITLTTGGTGRSERDLIARVMGEMGARVVFQGVRMSPGRTVALYDLGGRPVLALPGGLGGVEVGFEVLVRPALGFLLCLTQEESEVLECVAQEAIYRDPEEYRFAEARVWASRGQILVAPAPRRPRGWGVPVDRGQGWMEVPPGPGQIPKGGIVRVRCRRPWLG